MGRAIDMENNLTALEDRLKLVEDALEELVQTRIHHVDLTDTRDIVAEDVEIKGVELKPDEEYTAPVGKRKKAKRNKIKTEDPKQVESLL